ncbi:DUF4380 domain-containing protein [Mycobacterium sp. NPDC003449]
MSGAALRTWVTHGHHDVHWISADALTLGVVPALGGRLLSLSVYGHELLWRNPALLTVDLQPVAGHHPEPVSGTLADWRNYGGDKTWPAPQGWSSPQEWAGPPDPVLDSGPYAAEVHQTPGAVELVLTSEPDPRTGLQLRRTFAVAGEQGFHLLLSASNVTDRDVTWALWNVTQLPGGGAVEVAVGERFTEPVELVIGTAAPRWERTGPDTVTVGPQDVVGKLGFPYAAGRLGYQRDGYTVTWEFAVDDTAAYPDGGSRAEVWMECRQPVPLAELGGLDPPDRIVECEVLSPSYTLAPGETMNLRVDVGVHLDACGGSQ